MEVEESRHENKTMAFAQAMAFGSAIAALLDVFEPEECVRAYASLCPTAPRGSFALRPPDPPNPRLGLCGAHA